MHVSHWEL